MMMDDAPRQAAAAAAKQRAAAAAGGAAAAAADAQSDRRGAVRNDGVGCVASEPEITMQTHTTRLSASNTVKKAAVLTLNAQTRRLLRILGGDVSQKDQSKCHS
jgi:hypothetical protein